MKFEKVSRFYNTDLTMPERKTKYAAGYDFAAAEDILIQPYEYHMNIMKDAMKYCPYTIDDMAAWTKKLQTKPTLIPTGIKAKLNPDTYLELTVRSSSPLKYWLVLANGTGIIDADYYDNKSTEGEIFFQVINLSPFPIMIKKRDIIGQGIIKRYYTTEDDKANATRTGGFGSTSK